MISAPCFVVSTGRCGSTFLSDIFNRHPEVLSVSEFIFSMAPDPLPDAALSGPELAGKLTRVDPLVSAALRQRAEPVEFRYPIDAGLRFDRETGVPAIAAITLPHLTEDPDATYDDLIAFADALPTADVGTQYSAIFDWLRERFGGAGWVERSGGSLHYLPGLMAHFPTARFIHLYRDGRETAISMSTRDNFRLLLAGAEIQRLTGVNPAITPDAPIEVDLPEPLRRLTPASLDIEALRAHPIPIERFGLHWSAVILQGLRTLERIPSDRVLEVAYEDLVAKTPAALERLADFLELKVTDEWTSWATTAARPQPSRWALLPEPERERLDSACRIANKRLYGPDGPPVSEGSISAPRSANAG